MRKSYIVILILLLVIGYLVYGQKGPQTVAAKTRIKPSTTSTLPVSTTIKPAKKAFKKSEKGKLLVLTFYRSGEGESDLSAYVSRGMNYEVKESAVFKQIEVSSNPQIVISYGIETLPATIFLSPSGKTLYKHNGYASKQVMLKVLSMLKGR